MSFQTMIALVGEQPMPNLIVARHIKPNHVLLCATKGQGGTMDRATQLKTVLEQGGVQTDLICVDAYDIDEIRKVIETELESLGSTNSVVFNLTGGTKPMSFAANEISRDHKATTCYLETGQTHRLHTYAWHDSARVHATELVTEVTVSITLKEFLIVHCGLEGFGWQESRSNPNDFEIAVRDALFPRLVDELAHGINIPAINGELDLIMRRGLHFAIAELKDTHKQFEKGVRQLQNAGRKLGLFTRKLYATSNLTTAREHIEPWEKEGICFRELIGFREQNKLSSEDIQKLETALDQILGSRTQSHEDP